MEKVEQTIHITLHDIVFLKYLAGKNFRALQQPPLPVSFFVLRKNLLGAKGEVCFMEQALASIDTHHLKKNLSPFSNWRFFPPSTRPLLISVNSVSNREASGLDITDKS